MKKNLCDVGSRLSDFGKYLADTFILMPKASRLNLNLAYFLLVYFFNYQIF